MHGILEFLKLTLTFTPKSNEMCKEKKAYMSKKMNKRKYRYICARKKWRRERANNSNNVKSIATDQI